MNNNISSLVFFRPLVWRKQKHLFSGGLNTRLHGKLKLGMLHGVLRKYRLFTQMSLVMLSANSEASLSRSGVYDSVLGRPHLLSFYFRSRDSVELWSIWLVSLPEFRGVDSLPEFSEVNSLPEFCEVELVWLSVLGLAVYYSGQYFFFVLIFCVASGSHCMQNQ